MKGMPGMARKTTVQNLPQAHGRPGSRRRTSETELLERIELTEELLTRGFLESEIKRQLMGTYSISARTVENYLCRARERMLSNLALGKDEHRASALAFYRSIIRSETSTISERLRAQQQICWMLGLNAAVQGGPDEHPQR